DVLGCFALAAEYVELADDADHLALGAQDGCAGDLLGGQRLGDLGDAGVLLEGDHLPVHDLFDRDHCWSRSAITARLALPPLRMRAVGSSGSPAGILPAR